MSRNSRQSIGSAAEMPLTMIILFVLGAFPLINLISLGLAYGAIWFISFQCAQSASTQTDFNSCLSAVEKRTAAFNGHGFTNMLKMVPEAGYKNSGCDLFIDAVDFMDASKCTVIGPNKPIAPPIDLTNRFYEIAAHTTYKVNPLIDLKAVPFLATVPALGTPVVLKVKVKRCAEFPQGLTRGPGDGNLPANAAQQSPATSFASPILAEKEAAEPWYRPQIYAEIQASGSNILDHTVVEVPATRAEWTDTGVTVAPGQTVWLDFRADGNWGWNFGTSVAPKNTADGEWEDNTWRSIKKERSGQTFNLIGRVAPTENIITDRGSFNIGTSLYKYKPTSAGKLVLGFNDLTSYDRVKENITSRGFSGFTLDSDVQFREQYEKKMKEYYSLFHRGSVIARIIVTN